MILHVDHGFIGQIWDLDTGLKVPGVRWIDTDRGIIEAFKTDADGNFVKDINGDWMKYTAKGRFKVVPRQAANGTAKIVMGAPSCARCGNPLTLRGGDLCAFCNAKDKGTKQLNYGERLPASLIGVKCEDCTEPATWSVGDEITATPQEAVAPIPKLWGGGRGRLLFDRAATVRRRYYCSKHYVGPRLLDAKGEVIETDDEANGVRPQ